MVNTFDGNQFDGCHPPLTLREIAERFLASSQTGEEAAKRVIACCISSPDWMPVPAEKLEFLRKRVIKMFAEAQSKRGACSM